MSEMNYKKPGIGSWKSFEDGLPEYKEAELAKEWWYYVTEDTPYTTRNERRHNRKLGIVVQPIKREKPVLAPLVETQKEELKAKPAKKAPYPVKKSKSESPKKPVSQKEELKAKPAKKAPYPVKKSESESPKKPVSVPVQERVPEPEPEPVLEPKPVHEPFVALEPEPVREFEPDQEPVKKPETELEEPVLESEKSVNEFEPESVQQPDIELEPVSESVQDLEPQESVDSDDPLLELDESVQEPVEELELVEPVSEAVQELKLEQVQEPVEELETEEPVQETEHVELEPVESVIELEPVEIVQEPVSVELVQEPELELLQEAEYVSFSKPEIVAVELKQIEQVLSNAGLDPFTPGPLQSKQTADVPEVTIMETESVTEDLDIQDTPMETEFESENVPEILEFEAKIIEQAIFASESLVSVPLQPEEPAVQAEPSAEVVSETESLTEESDTDVPQVTEVTVAAEMIETSVTNDLQVETVTIAEDTPFTVNPETEGLPSIETAEEAAPTKESEQVRQLLAHLQFPEQKQLQ
ncbi:unnamed protein product [Meganyctiphanes norvegica]|uniref:Uncharacterized protein n=1 Tax=Meganyctiphanes norvegica TaxID=48144 RepID=A0AAV2RIE4_MEGNR